MYEQIMEVARQYSRLGSALQEQVESALSLDLNENNFNPSAHDYVNRFLNELLDAVPEDESYPVEEALEYLDEYMRGDNDD